MDIWNAVFRRQLILSGEVAIVRLTVDANAPEGDKYLWEIASDQGHRLREAIRQSIHEHLGPEFDVRSVTFARGSLEVLVVIGTLYYVVSRYKNFVESIELLLSQLKRLLAGFFESRVPSPVSVQGSWSPGPGLAQAVPNLFGGTVGDSPTVVVGYLVLSHAAMLAVVLG